MTSIFNYSRQNTQEEPEEIPEIFSDVKKHTRENIIPPVGIAQPELLQSFQENIENEDKILESIKDAEEYARETGFETSKREALSHGARGLEGFLGGINSFLNMLTPDLELEDLYGEVEKHKPSGLPGPEELKEFTKEKTGKYLEPKTNREKSTQEVASDIGSMFSTPGLPFWQKLLLPIGGQLVKQGIKASGGSETAQEFGKLGFTLIGSIAGNANAPKVAVRAINDAESMLAQGLRFSAQPTENIFRQIKNKPWFKTGRTSSKGPAMDEISRIEKLIQNGTMDAHEAMQLRRDIQEVRKGLGGFSLIPKVDDPKAALKYLDEVDNALLASFENYGKHVDPKWLKNYKLANEAFRITKRSQAISEFIGKYARPFQSDLAKTLFHIGGAAAFTHLPASLGAAIPVIGGLKLIQATNRMIRSSVLRNHYLKVIAAAEAGNQALLNKELEKFDIISKKLEKNQSSSPEPKTNRQM